MDDPEQEISTLTYLSEGKLLIFSGFLQAVLMKIFEITVRTDKNSMNRTVVTDPE